MFSLLKRWLPPVLGLLLLSLLIWVAGPYLGFNDYRPLESATVRLVLIALIVLAWVASLVLKRLRAARASDRLVAAVVQQSQADASRPSADAVQLRERFEEAIATLKAQRKGGQSLYDLPWYVIIGAPGSGKTTALVNSGLHFPLEQRSGKGALRGIGGTRNCDWWFTDEAVFLDTAGRYTTQDSDASADSAGWKEFLALLRKYRGRRPVNGVILTISAQDLMTQGTSGAQAHVEAARRRLIELNTELKIQLPVYLMVTKTDLVAGFTEFFDTVAQDGRAQVWGVTFPYDQTMKGEGPAVFPAEFDALIERLTERVFELVEAERDVRRRAKVFAFPQQLAALRDSLTQFVSDVFASTRFDQKVLLRGVYFTSGTQEGTPIDRLLGTLSRQLAIAPSAVAPTGRGKAYFIERLLKDVLFAESGLAGVNRRFEVQKAAGQLGAYAAMAAITLIGIVVWWISYSRNHTYLEEVSADAATLREVPPVAPTSSLDAALPRLDAVRRVVDSASRYQEDTPWMMRWGLYQGDSVRAAAFDAYTRELDGALLPHVATRFRQRLEQYGGEPEKLYEYLKAYLMLGNPEHLDKNQLTFMADLEWKEAYPDADRAANVGRHFRSLLDGDATLRPVALDQAIITQARSTLAQASKPGLIYRYLRIEYAGDTARALQLNLLAGVGAERVLRRKSGVSLAEPVPSIYTKPVFTEITAKGTDELVKQFSQEFWVWGDARPSVTTGGNLAAEVLDIYEKDYIAYWDVIVKDIQAVPSPSLGQTKEALAILGGATSPLRGFFKVVDEHTYLKPPEPAQEKGVIRERLGDIFKSGQQALGVVTTQPGAQITAHFDPIHRLVAGEPAPIDAILEKLRQLQQQVEPLGDTVGGTSPGSPQAINTIGTIATSLKRDVAALPSGIVSVVTQAADGASAAVRGGVRNTIESRYQADVVRECRAIVGNRYPFAASSAPDVPLADFGRLFGFGGVYDTFFRDELKDLVDVSRNPWAWRADESGAAVGGPVAMLRQFEAAQRIRDIFFRSGSQDPELRFSLTPTELDEMALSVTIEVDGVLVNYRHGPERTTAATWPGTKPGTAAVTFEEKGGNRPNIVADGPWAWIRLLEGAQLRPESDVRYILTFQQGGHNAQVRVEAPSIRNPYGRRDWQQFRCG